MYLFIKTEALKSSSPFALFTAPIFIRSSVDNSESSFILQAISYGSLGSNKKPPMQSSIRYGLSQTLLHITGKPEAIASHTTFGNPSYKDGKQNASAAL